jgi:hypothetical protein
MWSCTDISLAVNDYCTINDYGYFGFTFTLTFTWGYWKATHQEEGS